MPENRIDILAETKELAKTHVLRVNFKKMEISASTLNIKFDSIWEMLAFLKSVAPV